MKLKNNNLRNNDGKPSPLEKDINLGKFLYSRRQEGCGHYIYEKKHKKSGLSICFIVFAKRTKTEHLSGGRSYTREIFPYDEIGGSIVRSYKCLGSATDMFMKLVNHHRHA